jgi:hypothetical protein
MDLFKVLVWQGQLISFDAAEIYHSLKFRLLKFPAGLEISSTRKGLIARTVWSEALQTVMYLNFHGDTLAILKLRDMVFDPQSPHLPIELSVEHHVDDVYRLIKEYKSELAVGFRVYDDKKDDKNYLRVHMITHLGDKTKDLKQKSCRICRKEDGICLYGPNSRIERERYDRFLDTRLAFYRDEHILVDSDTITIGKPARTIALFGLKAVAIIGKQGV